MSPLQSSVTCQFKVKARSLTQLPAPLCEHSAALKLLPQQIHCSCNSLLFWTDRALFSRRQPKDLQMPGGTESIRILRQ